MYCTIVHKCASKYILDSIHVRFNHLCSFLPTKMFTSVLMNYTKFVVIANYNYIDNTAATGGSKYFELVR